MKGMKDSKGLIFPHTTNHGPRTKSNTMKGMKRTVRCTVSSSEFARQSKRLSSSQTSGWRSLFEFGDLGRLVDSRDSKREMSREHKRLPRHRLPDGSLQARLPAPTPSRAGSTTKDHADAENEAEVIPVATVVQLVDVHLVSEQRDHKRDT